MLLDVRDLRIFYDKVEAVKGVTFGVDEGEIVTLLGANGAGKTTLMKTISGLKRPTAGEITFAGKRIDALPPPQIVRLGIGHVPEGRHVFPYMSVEDNLALGAYTRGDAAGVRADIEDVYQHFPILKLRKNQLAWSLSGGEQQMLAIGRALMSRPKLLLMDEPSMGLSPIMVEEITAIVAAINQRGVAVLLVEQNASMALRLANRGYVVETGRIAVSGSCEELLDNEDVKRAYLGS